MPFGVWAVTACPRRADGVGKHFKRGSPLAAAAARLPESPLPALLAGGVQYFLFHQPTPRELWAHSEWPGISLRCEEGGQTELTKAAELWQRFGPAALPQLSKEMLDCVTDIGVRCFQPPSLLRKFLDVAKLRKDFYGALWTLESGTPNPNPLRY